MVDVETRVRQNVVPAAIAAGLLIFFGFSYVARPTEGGLWGGAALVFYHTLRFSGLAMAAIAIWSALGHPLALLVDAVISCLIGGLLIVTNVLMLVDGGDPLSTLIAVFCGLLFISAGRRNARDYLLFPVGVQQDRDKAAERFAFTLGEPETEEPATENGSSLPGELLRRSAKPTDVDPKPKPKATHTGRGARFASFDDAIQLPGVDASPSPPDDRTSPTRDGQDAGEKPGPKPPPSPDGYLADLADDDPADKP